MLVMVPYPVSEAVCFANPPPFFTDRLFRSTITQPRPSLPPVTITVNHKLATNFFEIPQRVFWRELPHYLPFYRAYIISTQYATQYAISKKDTLQLINQTSTAPISPAKPGSVARQPNHCSTAKSKKQFRNINRPWAVTVSMGERPNRRDVSSDIS